MLQEPSSRHQQQAQQPKTAAAMGIFDSGDDLAESQSAEAEQPVRQAARPQQQQQAVAPQRPQASQQPTGTLLYSANAMLQGKVRLYEQVACLASFTWVHYSLD